jgi:truncated hemoglobin YjbI
MRGAHQGLRITGEQRKAWADHMHAAAEEVGLSEEFRPRDQRWAR